VPDVPRPVSVVLVEGGGRGRAGRGFVRVEAQLLTPEGRWIALLNTVHMSDGSFCRDNPVVIGSNRKASKSI